MPRTSYPHARQADVQDDFHGTLVADPYRWLEDPDSTETQAWVAAENELTRSILDVVPAREQWLSRLRELWNYPRVTVPVSRDGVYFYTRNEGLQDQPVLVRQAGLAGEPEPLLDPNCLSEDGTVALINYSLTKDGQFLAYATAHSGSDWQEIRIREVATGRDFDDVIRWSKFTPIAWTPDGNGFYYSRYPAPGEMPAAPPSTHQRVYYHRLDTPQEEDRLVYARPDAPDLGFAPHVTHDGCYLLLHVWHGTDVQNRIYYRALDDEGDFVRLLDEADARYDFVGSVGSRFFFSTDLEAPQGRVIAIDVQQPTRDRWEEVVPEQEDTLDQVILVHETLVGAYLHQAAHEIRLFSLSGDNLASPNLPALGSIMQLAGKPEDREFFYDFQSFLQPPTIYRYDFSACAATPFFQTECAFDASSFQTSRHFYHSKDGTRVSLFLTGRKDLERNGAQPTLLYGYGGFAVNHTPFYSPVWAAWLEAGGILVDTNLRGGNEYGEAWHHAGMLDRKQNVFDDFIAAAEWLIENDYTRTEKLAIMGRSNGGLLVAACMLQRPDLFGAVLCGVPVIDMLRYHKFTAGRYWIGEYGNAEEKPEHFRFLYAYSPLHNVRSDANYPPTLITSADTDDRVVPMHAKKFAATLQALDGAKNPILLRVDMKAGHGLGKPTGKVIEEYADMFAFLSHALDL